MIQHFDNVKSDFVGQKGFCCKGLQKKICQSRFLEISFWKQYAEAAHKGLLKGIEFVMVSAILFLSRYKAALL